MVCGQNFSGDFYPPKVLRESWFCSVLDGCYHSSSADVVLVRTNNLFLHGEILAKAGAINSRMPLQLLSPTCNWAEVDLCKNICICRYDRDQKIVFSMRATLRHLLFYFVFIFHDERNHSIKISMKQA